MNSATKTGSSYSAIDIIRRKRDGGDLSDDQIDWVVGAYTRGAIAHEQMSALLMAILLNGMTRREISRWTAAMVNSGTRLDFTELQAPTTDKHSTGGVGDKITLVLTQAVSWPTERHATRNYEYRRAPA